MPLFAALEQNDNAVNNEYITEICIKGHPSQELLILPIISHLAGEDSKRWVTWINPPSLNRQILKQFGLEKRPILIINSDSDEQLHNLLLRCLNSGKSNTVVANLNSTSTINQDELAYAAINGKSHCLLIR
ncbi:Cell division inhibitor SulA [Sinobacterium norvegicum]|uniref:Cell division inhibitor SulA n=1 Tax=Sinobacterium norvegicum TaxID=1641715 RepID=A0ABM9AAS8_9GAMM|nr:SulA-like leucine-rich domain-containing protein [Sinobacterium norvegicum]CAH0989982.1 Cell division inhibitor SulA [Sinobacterium norvegicum]